MPVRIAIVIVPGSRGEPAHPAPGEGPTRFAPEGFVLSTPAVSGGRLTASQIAAATREAKSREASHLAILPDGTGAVSDILRKLAPACRANPDAVVLGRRLWKPPVGFGGRWVERIWPRFWLKVQTGRHLEDPASPVRVYPLGLIDHLRLYQSGKALDTEILVKSAWADAAFKEVPLDEAISVSHGPPDPLWRSLWRSLWRILLNIHFALRSVLPVPHRKWVAAEDRSGPRISVWRPMRSLRRLLSENASPLQLALAAAMGVFLGTLPLIACHTLVIMLAANYFRLNKVAALSASQLCMPPVVPALCIETGYWLRHGRFLTEISLETLGYQALERLYEWFLGALVLAPILAFLVGGLTLLLAQLAARNLTGMRHLKPTPDNGAEP